MPAAAVADGDGGAAGDGANANDVTSQAVADFGNAATFYDCLVEVEASPP